jgi:hypothetical protein
MNRTEYLATFTDVEKLFAKSLRDNWKLNNDAYGKEARGSAALLDKQRELLLNAHGTYRADGSSIPLLTKAEQREKNSALMANAKAECERAGEVKLYGTFGPSDEDVFHPYDETHVVVHCRQCGESSDSVGWIGSPWSVRETCFPWEGS